MFDLILSQGRVGDRVPRLIEGAAMTADAIAKRYGIVPTVVGTPSASRNDDWTESLPGARDTLESVAAAVDATLSTGRAPLIIASTCSSGIGTMPVVARHHPDVAVVYVDGHGDFNLPSTTTTGYLGGMVLSGVCGLWDTGHGAGVDPQRAVLLGSRDIDAAERDIIESANVRVLGPSEATPSVLTQAVGAHPIWVHIDWDVLDPGHVPADYTVTAGLTPAHLHELLDALPKDQIVGIEIGEFNPTRNTEIDTAATDVIAFMIEPVLDALANRGVTLTPAPV